MRYTGNVQSGTLEQVTVIKPAVTLYISGEEMLRETDISASAGNEKLSLVSLDRMKETGEGIHYYIDLDISASISWEAFSGLKTGLKAFGNHLRDNDRITLITFGEEVENVLTLTGAEVRSGTAWEETVSGLENPDQHTLFFEAMDKTAALIRADEKREKNGQEPLRRVMVVITDGEDIATGKATRTEALNQLKQKGLPVYSFTTEETAREYINSLGEFSRSTGGYLEVVCRGQEEDCFISLEDHLLSSYRAEFAAGNNRVSNTMMSVVLENEKTSVTQNREIMDNRWDADHEEPQITEIERCSENQIRVTFSEPMEGIGSAAGYCFKKEDGVNINGSFIPAYASPSFNNCSALLTFAQPFSNGTYTLSTYDMTDQSMERNMLVQEKQFTFEGETESETEEEETETENIVFLHMDEINTTGIFSETLISKETENGNFTEEMTEGMTEKNTWEMTEESTEEIAEEMTEEITEGNTEEITEEMTETGLVIKEDGGFFNLTGLITPVSGWFSGLSGTGKGLFGGGVLLALVLLALLIRKLIRSAGSKPDNPDVPGGDLTERMNPDEKRVSISVNGNREVFQVTIKGSMIVGRSEHCDLRFSDPTMSRQHFAIGTEADGLSVKNLSLSGFTTVNGQVIKNGEYRLKSGDMIGAGSMKLKIAW